jgi:hypothetical protein
MAEYINETDIKNALNKGKFTSDEQFKLWCLLDDMEKTKIVKCKNCKHCIDYGLSGLYCAMNVVVGSYVEPDFYCAMGE